MSCLKPLSIWNTSGRHVVPCGKCAFCLKTKRNEWIFRLHHEMRTQLMPAHFITLTYDEKHVPRFKGQKTLWFRHVQLYFKRLRKAGARLKYVAVGEYGTQTQRPHYHAILWTDASHDLLAQKWHHGHVHFGTVGPASIAYVLKYIVQPKIGDDETKQRTRAQFSKGLGASYLTAQVHEYLSGDEENPIFKARIDGSVRPIPRYYRGKIYTKYQLGKQRSQQYWKSIKERRKEYKRLMQLGHKDVKAYLRQRDLHNAQKVVQKVSFNQKL